MAGARIAPSPEMGQGAPGDPESSSRILFAPRPLPPLRADAASDLERYRTWLNDRRRIRLGTRRPTREPEGGGAGGPAPEITYLMVIDGSEAPAVVRRCIRRLADQTNATWRLSVGIVGSSHAWAHRFLSARRQLDRSAAAVRSPQPTPRLWQRVEHRLIPTGTSMPDALNTLLVAASSTAVALLDVDDHLEPDSTELLSHGLRDADIVYADEDELGSDGTLGAPKLKPGWSPELLLGTPYLGRPLAIRRDVLIAAGGIRTIEDGSWEHDMMLRVTEGDVRISHVPEVLCHRALTRHPTAIRPEDRASGAAAVVEALARRGETGSVHPGPLAGTYRVGRSPRRPVTVSMIIPFRDQPRFLRTCIDSITATASGETELMLVDNGSSDPETVSLLNQLERRIDITVLHDPRPFNWPELNNAAAREAHGEVLLFVNNDVEALEPGWVDAMTAQAVRPDVGVVGARLLYPGDRRVQHAGMVIGLGGAAGHVLTGLAADDPGYLGMAVMARECSAVTGACLGTRRSVFEALGGFDEQLGLDLNDVDYCLRATRGGLRVLYEPAAQLLHHESPSRGTSGSAGDIRKFVDRWEKELLAGDPFLNPNLTRVDSSCALRGPDEEGWWRRWRSTLPTR